MDIQHLIYALEVSNCGSISKAAQRLYMAQPNLSNAIKELERETNTILFQRTRHGIETTKDGAEFLYHANNIVAQYHHLCQKYVEQSPNLIKTSITTMRSSICCKRLIRYIDQINADGRFLHIHFREATNDEVIDDVNTGRAEIGILRANESSFDYFKYLAISNNCNVQMIPSSRYTVLMSRDHPLANQPTLTRDMLNPYVEVIHGDFEAPWYLCSDVYNNELDQVRQDRSLFVYDRGTLMDCIRGIRGAYSWTFSTAQENLEINGLVEKECAEYDIPGREAIIYKRSLPITNELSQLIDYLSREQ